MGGSACRYELVARVQLQVPELRVGAWQCSVLVGRAPKA